jgi:NTP pyrophosphatase (non-canonical NTP hydrolase)
MNILLKNALNEIRNIVHQNAVDHGFHNFEEDDGQFVTRAMMLLNTETAELFEAYRNHKLTEPCDKSHKMEEPLTNEEEEIADIIIRALDYAGRMKLDIGRAVAIKHAYNVSRPYRHGGKAA